MANATARFRVSEEINNSSVLVRDGNPSLSASSVRYSRRIISQFVGIFAGAIYPITYLYTFHSRQLAIDTTRRATSGRSASPEGYRELMIACRDAESDEPEGRRTNRICATCNEGFTNPVSTLVVDRGKRLNENGVNYGRSVIALSTTHEFVGSLMSCVRGVCISRPNDWRQ